jgi:hypothetical protein
MANTEINLWKIEIRKHGKRFGWLWLEKGFVYWKPANARKPFKVSWKRFQDLMRENG